MSAAKSFAGWSELTPKSMGIEAVLDLIRKDWTFAEEAVEELLRGLGLSRPQPVQDPSLEGAVELWGTGSLNFYGQSVPLGHQRHAIGYGGGFIGIWDRRAGGPPIRRFSYSEIADAAATWGLLVTEGNEKTPRFDSEAPSP